LARELVPSRSHVQGSSCSGASLLVQLSPSSRERLPPCRCWNDDSPTEASCHHHSTSTSRLCSTRSSVAMVWG
jgi:hypothetical protein